MVFCSLASRMKNEKQLAVVNSNENRLLEFQNNDNNLVVVEYDGSEVSSYNKNVNGRVEQGILI